MNMYLYVPPVIHVQYHYELEKKGQQHGDNQQCQSGLSFENRRGEQKAWTHLCAAFALAIYEVAAHYELFMLKLLAI